MKLTLNAGCTRSRQSTGRNAVSPRNRSTEVRTTETGKYWPPRPKNGELSGRSAETPLGVGRFRPSSSVSLTPVNVKNVRAPIAGASPFSTFWLYGSHQWPLTYG
jgi:hypothetical protein